MIKLWNNFFPCSDLLLTGTYHLHGLFGLSNKMELFFKLFKIDTPIAQQKKPVIF